jgi:hypothetical protein
MVSDSDYTEFDNFSKWLGVSQWNPVIFLYWTFFSRLYLNCLWILSLLIVRNSNSYVVHFLSFLFLI